MKPIIVITTKYKVYIIPIQVNTGLGSPRLDFLSKNGIRKKKRMPQVMRIIAIVSPLRPRISPGKSFNVWKRNKKYHSGLMFSGAGARRSAFFPISGGRNVARVTMIPRTTSQTIRSL